MNRDILQLVLPFKWKNQAHQGHRRWSTFTQTDLRNFILALSNTLIPEEFIALFTHYQLPERCSLPQTCYFQKTFSDWPYPFHIRRRGFQQPSLQFHQTLFFNTFANVMLKLCLKSRLFDYRLSPSVSHSGLLKNADNFAAFKHPYSPYFLKEYSNSNNSPSVSRFD